MVVNRSRFDIKTINHLWCKISLFFGKDEGNPPPAISDRWLMIETEKPRRAEKAERDLKESQFTEETPDSWRLYGLNYTSISFKNVTQNLCVVENALLSKHCICFLSIVFVRKSALALRLSSSLQTHGEFLRSRKFSSEDSSIFSTSRNDFLRRAVITHVSASGSMYPQKFRKNTLSVL